MSANFLAHSPATYCKIANDANDSTVRWALECRIPLLHYVFYDLKVCPVDEIR